jgi:hypothetical protein
MGNPWDNDPIVSAAPAGANPWDNDPIVGEAPKPKDSVGGAAHAVASGISSGILDLVGLPVDTGRNVIELGKAGAGFLYHETTGKPIPSALEPLTVPAFGGSEWLKQKMRGMNVGPFSGSAALDVAPSDDTMTNRLLHGAGEMVPGALADDPAAVAGSIGSRVVTGAATGLAQQGAAEAGLDPTTQTAVAMLGGAAVGRAAAARAAARAAATARTAPPTRVESTGGFSVTPSDVPGEAPTMNIGGRTTAADQHVVHEFNPPTPEGTTSVAVPTPEQAARAQTLRNIGLQEARESAVTGASREAGTDYQTSRVDSATGQRMGDVIDGERSALQSYAGRLRENAGGTAGVDDDYTRGATIAKPVEQLRDYFEDQTKAQYAVADKKADGAYIKLPETAKALDTRSEFLGTADGKQLLDGIRVRMREMGMADEYHNMQPSTVKQAEALKQYLNDQWSPRTGRLINRVKNAIDEDVAAYAGTDIYAQARKTRAQRSTLLDDPTGIARLAPPTDRLGLNRSVPLENVPKYVANLPVDQFKHVVGTLRGVPTIAPGETALHTAATDALNEIRAHFTNKVEAAGNSTQGMWNVKAVNAYLRANQARMVHVFSPDEMRQFQTLNDAGHILRMDRSYPGSAAQAYNLRARGALAAGKLAAKTGAVAGVVATHGMEGGLAGHGIAKVIESGAEKLAQRSMRSDIEKRIRQL